ncbi:MAG: hypothetical protein ACIAS6_02440 [Phycisphaerales bacterium JB060]
MAQQHQPGSGHQQAPNGPPPGDAHPDAMAGPPPLPEDFGDTETGKARWWQRELRVSWWFPAIGMSLVLAWLFLRDTLEPLLTR